MKRLFLLLALVASPSLGQEPPPPAPAPDAPPPDAPPPAPLVVEVEPPKFDPLAHYKDRAAAAQAGDVFAHLELAELCRSLNLPDEMRAEAAKVVELDPKNRPAHEMLRHALVEGRWLTPEEAMARGLVEYKGAFMTAAEHKDHVLRENWEKAWERKSGRFTLRTNTSKRKLDQFLAALAEFRDALERNSGVDCTSRAEVHIFRSARDYHELGGGPRGTGGYYSPGERVLKLYDDPQDIKNTLRVLFHEGTHMFANLTNKNKSYRNPIWLEEGLAEYYGSAVWDWRKEKFVFGNPLNDRIRSCHEHPGFITLEKLLTSPQMGYGGIHYAFGWSLVMYLSRTPESAKQLGRYLKEVRDSRYAALYDNDPRRRRESLEVFQRLFLTKGQTLADFEKGWLEYVKGLQEVPGAPDFLKKFRKKDDRTTPGHGG